MGCPASKEEERADGPPTSLPDKPVLDFETKDTMVLAVFDGHSGREAASFAQQELLSHIEGTKEWGKGDIKGACVSGFLATDQAMREAGVCSGTTAVMAFVTPEELIVANCGDSRSVLSRGGRQLPMSIDHKPGRKGEKRRIMKAGGNLDSDSLHARIIALNNNMSIATSRALGDFDFKRDTDRPPGEQMVSPVPEFYQRERVPEDEFLILASDGVWDVMENPEVVGFLKEQSHTLEGSNGGSETSGGLRTPPRELALRVLKRCLDMGSLDNMTVVLADLRPPPTPPTPVMMDRGGGTDTEAETTFGGGQGGAEGGGGRVPLELPGGDLGGLGVSPEGVKVVVGSTASPVAPLRLDDRDDIQGGSGAGAGGAGGKNREEGGVYVCEGVCDTMEIGHGVGHAPAVAVGGGGGVALGNMATVAGGKGAGEGQGGHGGGAQGGREREEEMGVSQNDAP